MDSDRVVFSENIHNKNGSIFEFKYEGIIKKENIDTNNINELITKYMMNNHENMVKNVRLLRTILKDYDEKFLALSYQSKNLNELIKFYDSNIFLYKRKEFCDEINKSLITKYTPDDNINFKFVDTQNNKLDYLNIDIMSDRIINILQELEMLNHIKPIELDHDSKRLIEIYQLFYAENPNFNSDDINIKLQAMMALLAEFNVTIVNYFFSLFNKSNIPTSLEISDLVCELFPLGEIKDIYDPVTLNDEEHKIISIAGKETRKVLEAYDNEEDILKIICNVLYAARYHLSYPTTNYNDLLKHLYCSENEFYLCKSLVNKISNILYYEFIEKEKMNQIKLNRNNWKNY
ncbi:MAG: hypothetical protein IJ572_00490 [Bacilli bacterium]|nr:hypothetical protein [Bacilli bacterium]